MEGAEGDLCSAVDVHGLVMIMMNFLLIGFYIYSPISYFNCIQFCKAELYFY